MSQCVSYNDTNIQHNTNKCGIQYKYTRGCLVIQYMMDQFLNNFHQIYKALNPHISKLVEWVTVLAS